MVEVNPSDPARVRLPFRTVIVSMIVLWSTYFVLGTLRSWLMGHETSPEVLVTRLAVTVFGIFVTIGLWFILRLFDRNSLGLKVAVIIIAAMPGAIIIANFNVQAFAPINERMMAKEKKEYYDNRDPGNVLGDPLNPSDDDPDAQEQLPSPEEIKKYRDATTLEYWRYVTDVALGRYFLLLSWGALYLAMLAGAQARASERRENAYREAANRAELRSLRYQVNPHFLFNTLNSLSALILTDKNERAEEMVQSIASFYRQSLTSEPTVDVTLDEEFDLQRHYLEIEAVRFPERLQVKIELPPHLADARIPGMILQPLVENSVKYGVSESTRPITITISAREEFSRLVVSVEDDGPGGVISDVDHGHGIGLTNVRQRLEARFGAEANLVSGPVQGGYATHIRVPLVRGRNGL